MANYPPYGYNTPQMAQGQPMLGPQGQPGYIPQAIPADAIIGAPVVVTIGTGTVQYPLTKANCAQAVAANLRTRTRYPVCVSTSATGGTFRLLGRVWCAPDNRLSAIDGGAAV